MRSLSQTQRLHAAIGHVVINSLFNPYRTCKLRGLIHALPRTPNEFADSGLKNTEIEIGR